MTIITVPTPAAALLDAAELLRDALRSAGQLVYGPPADALVHMVDLGRNAQQARALALTAPSRAVAGATVETIRGDFGRAFSLTTPEGAATASALDRLVAALTS